MPFDDEPTCMRTALDVLGPHLFALPDGEIGEKTPRFPNGIRIAWVMYAIETMTLDHANWRVVKEAVRGADGMAVDYRSIQKLRPLRRPSEMPNHVSLGYDRYFRKSYREFVKLRSERSLHRLKFQMGVPTGFAMGGVFASPLDWIRYTPAFNTVVAREVNAAIDEAGDDLIVQIEVPPELYVAYKLPGFLLDLALRPILDLLAKLRPGARIGVHLCLGDFHRESLLRPKTLDKMVAFSNRLVEKWRRAQQLLYVHFPFAEGRLPPLTDPAYYRPLREVRLPSNVRFAAGFIHEKRTLEENRRILAAIEEARGHEVVVSSSCGLGRRTQEEAREILELTRQVLDS
jgi:hypothetical protein